MSLITKTFDAAQVFYIDPSTVGDASTCDISSIDLYFKFKPDLNLNRVGGTNPGVVVSIAETKYGIPSITQDSGVFTGNIARLSLLDITSSSDATVPSTFRFPIPVTIETDKEYCFVVEFELSADYSLWTSVQGEVLTGTTNISPGPSDEFIGKYYGFNGVFTAEDNTNLDDYLKNWRSISDTSLKFSVNVARYSHSRLNKIICVPIGANGSIDADDIFQTNPSTPITSNSSGINFNINFGSYEFIVFDENISTKAAFVGGQMAYQNTVFYPGGWNNSNSYIQITTVSGNNRITANTQLPNGSVFQWSTIFSTDNPNHGLVITDGNTKNVRRVGTIISNTVLQLTENISFSNTDAKVMIAPLGRVDSFNKASPYGVDDAILMIANSSANSTVRFVNNTITSTSIVGGGSGYSNGDVLYVKGFEDVPGAVSGGYVAAANLVTNSTGGITSLYFSNLGCGFVNTSAMVATVANSTQVGNTTSNTTAGTGASFTYTTGADIRTEYGSSLFRDCQVRNLDIAEIVPFHDIVTPPGVDYTLKLETNYVKKANSSTLSGYAYYVNDGVSNNQLDVVMYDTNVLEFMTDMPVVPSKSNEYQLLYEDTTANDKLPTANASTSYSQSIRLITDVSANSDYATVRMRTPVIRFSKYIINNDATNEHTDSGSAFAKGLSKIVNFQRTSEDMRVYLTAYKPANTDLKIYARLYKNEDPESFDDKNWTELELKDGVGLVSSSDPDDLIELVYGLRQVPEDRTPLDGAVQIASGDATITGSGTDFVTDLTVGDLVYMYQPLFVENHMIASVTSITNTTSFEMDQTTSNSSILAEGMNIEKITYPEQAFNNKQSSNVCRYYNGSTASYDGYESVAIKVVFLSPNQHKIPRVDDWRIVGVSA